MLCKVRQGCVAECWLPCRQRCRLSRIMFTMWQQRLTADAKFRKSAKVVGDVMGNYHPHGDSSIYEALVRQAQPWVMRAPLVEGSGNFGSIDGDPPAAMRYTECRLQRIADELLSEIGQQTVHFRPSYDGTKSEPVVLPSRIPNTLLSGSTGIAVGMATNIPPHNLGELCKACIKLLDDPELQDYQLVANDAVQGPDFPTGGQILNSKDELREIYKTGQGPIRIRATTKKRHGLTRGSNPHHRFGALLRQQKCPRRANRTNHPQQKNAAPRRCARRLR